MRDRVHLLSAVKACWHHLLYSTVVLISCVPMMRSPLSDDQITYWTKAELAMKHGGLTGWDPTASFSYLLGAAYHFTQDKNASFVLIYLLVAVAYLYVMRRTALLYTGNPTASTLIAVISIVPHYTLGMTYWGFAGFEFIKARILIMPFVPIIISSYFRSHRTTGAWRAYLMCGSVCLLNLEAAYLGAILFLHTALFVIKDGSVALKPKILNMAGAICLFAALYAGYSWIAAYSGTSTIFEFSIYDHLIGVVGDQLSRLDDAAYIDLRWQAAKDAFWWAMFPPRVTDMGMFVGEHAAIIAAAYFGAVAMRRSDREKFSQLLQLCFCIVIVTYGYQIFRIVLGLAAKWPPDIREEVRAFKFVIFPFMIWAAYLIGQTINARRVGLLALIIPALLISPVQLIRSIPANWKATLVESCHKYLSGEKLGYFEKLVEYRNAQKESDIDSINQVLSGHSSGPAAQYVMTTEHKIKMSGLKTLVSYQDKRAGIQKIFFDNPTDRNDYLAVWSYAYSEIKSAIHSKDPDRVVAVADKYACRYVVVETRLVHPRLNSIYEGLALSCYEVNPAHTIEMRAL
jgi:hypothetical protein